MKRSRLAITICATKGHQHALSEQARCVATAVAHLSGGDLVMVTDGSEESAAACRDYRRALGKGFRLHHLREEIGRPRGRRATHLAVGKLRTAAFARARALGATECWSLDSDVLPPPNALVCMQQMLSFDGGYYGVASCPYLARDGSGFLFGRGSFYKHIEDDATEEERLIPPRLRQALARHRARRPAPSGLRAWAERMAALEEAVRRCPPREPDVTKRAFRPRGTGEAAYPGVGKGSVVPTDWCGFGCTLLGQEALRVVRFTAFTGAHTEDLHAAYHEWLPRGIRICALPHVVCDHVVRQGKRWVCLHAYHEPEGPERGHLRAVALPWKP